MHIKSGQNFLQGVHKNSFKI